MLEPSRAPSLPEGWHEAPQTPRLQAAGGKSEDYTWPTAPAHAGRHMQPYKVCIFTGRLLEEV